MIKDIFKKKSQEELKDELDKLVSVQEKDRNHVTYPALKGRA